MNADDFCVYMLSFLFLRYLSDNYETAAKKELRKDYPSESDVATEIESAKAKRTQQPAAKKAKRKPREEQAGEGEEVPLPIVTPLQLWYSRNKNDVAAFEKQMRRKVHYVIQPQHLWNSIANMARTRNGELLNTLQAGFKYIETESFESTFQGLFSEINLGSDKLGSTYADRNAKLCTIIQKIAEGLNDFSADIDALGDAYEYLIGQFAAGSGKKAGEFYTPQQISDILSTIVTLDSQEPKTGPKKRLESVLDFACGLVSCNRLLGGATPLGRCRTNDHRPATVARKRHEIASDGLVDQARHFRTSECGRALNVNRARLFAGPLQQFRRIRQFLSTIEVQLNAIRTRADCKNSLVPTLVR